MAFLESPRFPENISLSSKGGSQFKTTIIATESGFESRNQDWKNSRYEFNATFGIRDSSDILALVEHFNQCRGKLHGFRYKDWSDYRAVNQPIAKIGEKYYLYKKYGSVNPYYRKIVKPVSGTVAVKDSGGAIIGTATVNYATGEVTGTGVDETCLWSGEFDVPVRYDIDSLQVSVESNTLMGIEQIMLVEVRL